MKKTKVYIADTTELNDTLFLRLYDRMSDKRKTKIDKCAYEKDKKLSLTAGVLLEKALSDFGIKDKQISNTEYGKPILSASSDFFFNLSHSGEKVMCAVSDNEIGCDVERIRAYNPRVAKQVFTANEQDAILSKNTSKEQSSMFFRFWTLKESFMKITGLGLKLPPNSFEIKIIDDNITVHQQINDFTYHFKEFDFNDGYKYAVCAHTNDFDEVEIVSLSDF